MEEFRVFLARYWFSVLQGITFDLWWEVLKRNRFRIDPVYWPRASFLTAASLLNSGIARWEERRSSPPGEVKPPLFILGHFRSGTTYLHNLLANDAQFVAPTLFQTLYPRTYLTTERWLAFPATFVMNRSRPQDNVAVGMQMPAEDEFALCAATALSPYLGWVFPRSWDDYAAYYTFREVPEDEVARWKAALLRFVEKLGRGNERRSLLKSPAHTAHIRLLLELFPDALFVHIHRDPFAVFQSTKRMWERGNRHWRLHYADEADINGRIINTYKTVYESFFEERALIPAGHYHEIGFEDLERRPIDQIEVLYQAFHLTGFAAARTALQGHLKSVAGFQKNVNPGIPETLRHRIVEHWWRCFEEWGYPAI